MEQALDRADDLIAEGRDSLGSLRGSEDANGSLEEALHAVASDLAKATEKTFHSSVLGSVQALHPIAREELFRIGSEALTNAFTHAMASSIEMEIVYDRAHFLLRVRAETAYLQRSARSGLAAWLAR
jgi:signal transduction histidine kinase